MLPNCPRLDVAVSTELLRYANVVSGREIFSVCRVGPSLGEQLHAADGELLMMDRDISDVHTATAVLVIGGHPPATSTAQLYSKWLNRLARHGTLLAAVDWGVVLLAEAGLLKNKRAAAHWEVIGRLLETCPDIEVSEQLFVFDDNRLTGAGRLAIVELTLYLIRLLGSEKLAASVAQDLIYASPRPPNSPQRLARGLSVENASPRLQKCIRLMEQNIHNPLSLEVLASAAGVSARQLNKIAAKELNCSIIEHYVKVRLNKARELILHTELSCLDVSIATGFSSASTFSRSFSREFGTPPRAYRREYKRSRARPFSMMTML